MFKIKPYSLAWRTVPVITIILLAVSYLFVDRNEKLIEEALLEQVKQQAVTFLDGISSGIQRKEKFSYQELQRIISEQPKETNAVLSFAVYQMYAFDQQGNIVAHSKGLPQKKKQNAEKYAKVFELGQVILGDHVEEIIVPGTGHKIKKIDVIIPVVFQGVRRVALEVEIDLEKTYEIIAALDDDYENEFLIITIIAISLTVLFIWIILYESVIQPLQKVAEVAHSIAEGDLSVRLGYNSKSELGDLSHTIDVMADSIESLFNEQEKAHLQMLQSLAKALEAKDSYTAGHSGRVSKYSVMLGKRIGLDNVQLQMLKEGALMHDIGKIGIADEILNKPVELDEYEFEIMKKHPVITAAIMKPLKRFKAFSEIAAWHHERWDGTGYPDGLKGEQIPLLARIVGIADTWDAMTGDRVYRKGLTTEKALSILKKESLDGQWDPELLVKFIIMIEEQSEHRQTVLKNASQH